MHAYVSDAYCRGWFTKRPTITHDLACWACIMLLMHVTLHDLLAQHITTHPSPAQNSTSNNRWSDCRAKTVMIGLPDKVLLDLALKHLAFIAQVSGWLAQQVRGQQPVSADYRHWSACMSLNFHTTAGAILTSLLAFLLASARLWEDHVNHLSQGTAVHISSRTAITSGIH